MESRIETLILQGDRIAVVDRAQPTPDGRVHRFADEADVAIAEQGVDPAGVPASGGSVVLVLAVRVAHTGEVLLRIVGTLTGIQVVRAAGIGRSSVSVDAATHVRPGPQPAGVVVDAALVIQAGHDLGNHDNI